MLLLEPLWLCWFGAVVLFTWWTYQQRPAWVQPAWWRRPMGSDWRNHQLFQPAETPQQGSLAVMHALLLLSRVGEWVQLVCWIGIGWPRAASPAQGYKGPELGSWPSSWLLPRGQRSARSAAQCWEGSGWACSAALLSGTATSPWEVQGTCNIWWELGRKEQRCIYAPQLPWFFFFHLWLRFCFLRPVWFSCYNTCPLAVTTTMPFLGKEGKSESKLLSTLLCEFLRWCLWFSPHYAHFQVIFMLGVYLST